MPNKLTTKTKTTISPLLDQKKRKAALKQARGIWKHKKKKVTQEYNVMRKEWDRK